MRPSTPELARRIVDRVLIRLATYEVLPAWWYDAKNEEAQQLRESLVDVAEKVLVER